MNAKPALILSLMVNVGLVGAVAYLATSRSVSVGPAPNVGGTPAAKDAAAVAVTKPRPAHVTNVVFKSFDWQSVESPDYKEYIANLRSIGCPEETIRDIIIADVNKLFEDRKKALKKPFKFWVTGMGNMMGGGIDEQTSARLRDLAAEKKALIRELLGIELNDISSMVSAANPYEHLLGFLPVEKQSKVMELYQDFAIKQSSLVEAAGSLDAEDMKKMQALQKEMEGEVAKMLTTEEFENYELTLSQTAMMMRMTLDGFQPSEQEFRDMFKAQKAFDDEYLFSGVGGDDEGLKPRAEADEQRKEQMKSILGDQRFADYQRETDYQFKALSKVADRQGLPKESAIKVWDMKAVAEQEANRVRSDSSLNPQQRQAALQAVRAETERSISKVLGDDGFGSYKKQNGAWWLNGISQESSTKVPAVQTTIIANP